MEKAEIMRLASWFVIFVAGIVIGRITMAIQYEIMRGSADIVKKMKK